MPFPNLKGKHSFEPVFGPDDFVAYMKKTKLYPTYPAPKGIILCYWKGPMQRVLRRHRAKKVRSFYGDMYLLGDTGNTVAVVGGFGIGAPAAAALLEELISCGTTRFVSVGTAGGLQRPLRNGDVVVCGRAIRDEGTSHHYLKPSKYAHASPAMVAHLARALERRGISYVRGTTWTIDAPYRETVQEARHYQREGVATVEMEAAALFAVATVRGAQLASVFTISDSLAELEWKPEFHTRHTAKGLETLFSAAVEALLDPEDCRKRRRESKIPAGPFR